MDVDELKKELGTPTIAQLARKLGVSGTYLHDLKKGRRGVTLRMATAVERETGRSGVVDAVVRERTA